MPQEGTKVETTGTSLQTIVENPRNEIPKVTFPKGRVAPIAGDQIRTIKLGILPGGKSAVEAGHISSFHTLLYDVVIGDQVLYSDTQGQTSPLVAIHSDPEKGQFLFLTESGSIYSLVDWQPAKDRSQVGKGFKSAAKKIFS